MRIKSLLAVFCLVAMQGCGVYSFSGAATSAKTIAVDPFFNNTDLAPANLGQVFTNRVKDYYQQNSSLRVIPENGELHIEGIISEYRINPIAPVSTNDPNQPYPAALSRLTIAVKVTYEDNINSKNNFKDRTFSFYRDFDNSLNFTSVQEDLEKKIFDQILIDIFNATVANW
ncbi:MAG: LptE family protein [Bacteroidetes bacterium]|nr:LptE family protein [Bacteroidota bacterium]MBS1978440.1 LptE family protein [Bacteroidota bacterium]